jgi:preprotein translocase subunit YajC
MIDVAYAMAQPGGQGGGDVNTLIQLLPMVLIFAVFYLLLIRPQQKKAKEHKQMLDNLKKGDTVITQGGIYGRVAAIEDQVVFLEIAKDIKVKVVRGNIATVATTPASVEPKA